MKKIYTLTQKAFFVLLLVFAAISLNAQVSVYTFSQSSSAYAAISGGTLLGSTTSDDQIFINPGVPLGGGTATGVGFPIGFNFTYNGIVFDRVAIDNNGWISLGQSSLTPSTDINSSSQYGPLASTATNTPTLLRNRIAGVARDLQGQAGSSVRIQTIGTTPNQICVIQWAGYKRYGTTGTGDNLNFQIQLYETTNVVQVQFGGMTFGTGTNTGTAAPEVGLGGTTSTDYNNRVTTTNWNSTTGGAQNNLGCDVTAGVTYPVSGTTFAWTPPAICAGSPVAGTIVTPSGACNAVLFDLSLTGTTSGSGITYQWISSPDDVTYTYIGGATTGTANVSQTADTYYRCIVTCTNSGLSDTAVAVLITMNAVTDCYCIPTTTDCSLSDVIENVTFAGINNSTACTAGGYTYYTSPTGTVMQGITYPVSVTVGPGGTEYVAVWIDYDHNGVFDASEFTNIGFGNGSTINSNITISPTALTGTTRMRVRVEYNTALTSGDACIGYNYGETEDYIVDIQAAVACTNPPVAGSISGNTSVCDGGTVSLVLAGYTLGTSLQWEESADGSTWSEISGETNAFYTTAAITDTAYYRVKVKCVDSVYTSTFEIDLNPFYACYCVAGIGGFCGSAEINNVNIPSTPLNNNSTCNSIGVDAYSSFPASGSTTATLFQGTSYTLNVNCSEPAIISVWIDYDHSGTFDPTEWTQVAVNAQNGTATVTIDANALLGQTGMRIRSRLPGNQNGDTDACLNFGSGECEDYVITIDVAPPCTVTPIGGVATGPVTGVAFAVYEYVVTGSTGDIQWQYSTTSATGPFAAVPGAPNDDTLQVTFNGAGTYWIRALLTSPGCDSDSSNAVEIAVTLSGDDVCDAIPLTLGINGPYSTTSATVQAGEPAPPGNDCSLPGNWCNSTITNSLWFTFVAPASGRVSIQSPDFDTQLALWDANACGDILTGGAALLAANDDDPDALLHGGVSYSSFLDSVTCLTPGRNYYIQLDPYTTPGASTTIVITDLGGTNIPLSVTLNSTTDVTCFGYGDGAIDMDVTGGSGSYSYQWDNGELTEDLSGLSGGSYTLSVTDAGCNITIASNPVTINEPTQLGASLDSLVDVKCFGESTGGIYITVTGGTAPYSFLWSDNSTNPNLSGVPAGFYTGTVTDDNGCILASPPVPIGEPAAPLALVLDSVIDNVCAGGSTGGVYITVSDGTAGYTYDWSDGATSEDDAAVVAGTYDVSVTDANGCTISLSSITVGDGAVVTATVDSVIGNTCAGLSVGGIYISVNGGSPSYTYTWSDGGTNEDNTGLPAGFYTVSVADANGCSATASETVVDGALVTVTVDSVTNNVCAGGSAGAVYITAGGGTPGYTYLWSNGPTSEDNTGLTTGAYTVSAQDAIGCTASASGTVGDGATVTVTLDSSSNVTCHGLANGSVSISVSGGSPVYSYLWSNSSTSQDISGLAGGNYSVAVNDANGCTASLGPVTIVEPAILTITLDSIHSVKCFGGNNGAAYTTVTGGTAPTTVLWDNSATTEDITNLVAGTYIATVKDDNECTATVSAAVTQPAAALGATTTNTDQVQGGALGSINITVTGGTSPYTSLWSNSATTEDLSNLAAGIYSCTITDANGCTKVIADTVKLITGIGSIEHSIGVNLYPNPTQNQVTLELMMDNASDVTVQVYNVSGQLINQFAERNILTSKFEMNFANEASGVYYAKIKIGDTTLARRIVVTK